jgi:hypothetical protein
MRRESRRYFSAFPRSQRASHVFRAHQYASPQAFGGGPVGDLEIRDFPILLVAQQDRGLRARAVDRRRRTVAVTAQNNRRPFRSGAARMQRTRPAAASTQQQTIARVKRQGVDGVQRLGIRAVDAMFRRRGRERRDE